MPIHILKHKTNWVYVDILQRDTIPNLLANTNNFYYRTEKNN